MYVEHSWQKRNAENSLNVSILWIELQSITMIDTNVLEPVHVWIFSKRLVIRIFWILNKFMEIIKYTSCSSGTYNKKFITPEILFCSIKMRISAQKGDFGKIIIDAEKNH